jgi:twitching motility protein PilT
MEITDLLIETQRNGASDLHLSPNNPPILRLNGEMVPFKSGVLAAEQIKHMLYSVMTEQQRAVFEQDFEVDFAISFGDNMRFRVNAFNNLHGPASVMRSIPTQIKSLAELGAPNLFKKLCEFHKGLILVTGPTGSGKSTTLAAIIDHINSTMSKHILTIEDPIEFVHVSKKSLINQREVGRHTNSFARALKSSLREDPDVILVGELRDLETIQLAITAAETGHLVLGTLHTNSAPETIDRIIDVFPAHDKEMVRSMLSVALQAVITQTLLKKREGGRVAAHEIMLATPAIRNLIRENKIPQMTSLMQIGAKIGMRTMRDTVYELLETGVITEQVARSALFSSIREDEGGDKKTKEEQVRKPSTGTAAGGF